MILFSASIYQQLWLLLFLVSISRSQKYAQQYQVHDTEDDSSESLPATTSSSEGPDYSKYFASETSPSRQTTGAAASEDSGFVRPIDFSALFAASGAGLGGDTAGSAQIFRPANSDLNTFALPLSESASVFSAAELDGSANKKDDGTGFTSPSVKFESLFDAHGSATEQGFRPQDFLKPAVADTDDRDSEGSSLVANQGSFFSPSFAKLGAEYKSPLGSQYGHLAVPAAAEQRPSKSTHHVSGDSDERDSSEYTSIPTEDPYDEKPKYKSTSESYSFKPSYKFKKPEYEEGKSSYPAPTEKYNYKPYSSPYHHHTQEKTNYPSSPTESEKTSFDPSYTSKSKSRTSPSETKIQGKTSYSSPAPIDIYAKPSAYLKSLTNQGEAQPRYTTTIGADIIYGKGKAPPYKPSPSGTHEGKASYTSSYPKDIYNDKYNVKPSPSAQYKYYGSTALPFNTGKPSLPLTKSVSSTSVSPSSKEETYQEESAEHGLPEYAPSGTAIDKKSCKKIAKHVTADDVATGRFRRDAMTCYQCDDPKTGGTFEQCSYTSDPSSKSYFVGHAQKYSTDSGTKPTTYRYRRYLSRDPFGLNAEEEEILGSETLSRLARQDSGYEYAATGNNEKVGDYSFDPEYFTSSSDDYAEYKASAANIDKKNCKKIKKDSMECMVCKDPKTNGSYEQCSYSTDPKKNNYFVAHQSSFSTGDKKPYTEQHSSYESPYDGYSSDEPHSRHTRHEPSLDIKKIQPKKPASKSKTEGKYDSPYEFSGSNSDRSEIKAEGKPGVGLDPFLYGKPDTKATDKTAEASEQQDAYFPEGKTYDEYFRHLFPELQEGNKGSASSDFETYEYPSSANTNSEQKTVPGFEYKSTLPEFFTDNEQKKDLEKVLGEFRQKDRSSCKKIIKDKMTCYECVDSKGMQHEECMFVAASEPKSSHLAYHEVKEYRLVPKNVVNDGKGSASASIPVASDSISLSSSDNTKTTDKASEVSDMNAETLLTTVTPKPKRKTFFKKVTTTSTAATPVSDNKYAETAQVDIRKAKQKLSKSASSSSNKSPGVAVKVTRRSSKTSILTTTTTTLTTPQPPAKKRKTSKKTDKSDSVPAASESSEKKVIKSKIIPTEPVLSASDQSPDGYYSAETKTRYDPVLKVTLPEYMLQRSEHEDVFDEVLASGRRR